MNNSRLGRETDGLHLEQEVIRLFKEAKFKVAGSDSYRSRIMGDIVAEHILLGRERRYAIEVVTRADATKIHEYASRLRNYARQAKEPFAEFDEFWLVAGEFPRGASKVRPIHDRHFRALDLGELKAVLAQLRPSLPKRPAKSSARTKIGKAIEKNEKEIDLAVVGLLLQIDDKLQVLRNERPNSADAIASRNARISDYERTRAELENIRQMVAQFKKGEIKEARVVQSVTTFADGIKSWWSKNHATICTRTFDLGLFASAVGICSMAGAGGNFATVVSAALVGGKSVTDALKGLTKKFLSD
jgi:hypothetical protein